MPRFKNIACAMIATSATVLADPAHAVSASEASGACLFSVKGSKYVQVLVTNKKGVETVKFKKTSKARKDKISDAAFDDIKANMSACIAEKTGS